MAEESHWQSQLVNLHQTPQDRRDKYFYLRAHGVSYSWACRARDFTWSHIEIVVRENPKLQLVMPDAP